MTIKNIVEVALAIAAIFVGVDLGQRLYSSLSKPKVVDLGQRLYSSLSKPKV